jgi:transcription antitermination factor NusG
MHKAIMGGVALLAIAALAWASDPWKSKPYQQWDQKDIQKILQDSPWSKVVRVEATWEANNSMSMPGSMPQQNAPRPGGSAQPGSPGGMPGGSAQPAGGGAAGPGGMPSGGMASATPQAVFVIRWMSSRTIREALVRSAVLAGQMKEEDAQKALAQTPAVYEVVIAGPQMTPFETEGEEGVKRGAVLETKKAKEKIQPSKVEFRRSPDGKTIENIVIVFPETADGKPTIGPNEKGAEFTVPLGRTTLKTSFDFSKMDDAKGRDL